MFQMSTSVISTTFPLLFALECAFLLQQKYLTKNCQEQLLIACKFPAVVHLAIFKCSIWSQLHFFLRNETKRNDICSSLPERRPNCAEFTTQTTYDDRPGVMIASVSVVRGVVRKRGRGSTWTEMNILRQDTTRDSSVHQPGKFCWKAAKLRRIFHTELELCRSA